MNVCSLLKTINLASSAPIRNYAFKSNLKIKWIRPEKIPCFKPEKSGDLGSMPTFDKERYPLEFQDCKELETADDQVKRLFSLEFAPRWKRSQCYIKDTVDLVRRHPLDKGSIEARLARWTGAVRALQEVMETHPRNKVVQVKLKELIDKRKKHLKYLRKWDYKKFEWVLENLSLVYKPPPSEFKWVTRKDSLRKLTQKYEDDIVNERMTAYRLQLQEEQPSFLREKIKTLEFIRDEQTACGVPVTVKQEDIDAIQKQLSDLLKQREGENEESK